MKLVKREVVADKSIAFSDVRSYYERNLHPDVLDLDDQHVYKHIYHDGRFAGVFQFTQRGVQRFIKDVKPTNVTDIATVTSIYRPGPLVAKVDDLYIDAKSNPESVVYEHPLVKKCLEETYGCIIFQESIMSLGHVVGGLSLEETDKLRKVITKRSVSGASKAKEDALKLEKKFIEGAVKNGLSEKQAIDLFEKISFFSGYGFNKSHALSYAIDSYMCAWLLTYFEPEWLCAYIETQAGIADKRADALAELKSLGYRIVNIDINHATDRWTIMPGKQFMPSFLTVKGMGEKAIEEVELNRPYKTVDDLLYHPDGKWKHSKFNKRAMEALIQLRAFGSMELVGEGKPFKSFKQMHVCVIEEQAKIKHVKRGRAELAARMLAQGDEEWTKGELLAMSKELLGTADIDLILSQALRDKLEGLNVPCIDDLVTKKGLAWFIADEVTLKSTKNGKPYLKVVAVGMKGKRYNVNVWSFDPAKHSVPTNTAFVAELDSNPPWGFSTTIWKVKCLGEKQ